MNMLLFILACVVSFIPTLALFFWLRNCRKADIAYRKLCVDALVKGMLSVFLIVLLSGASYFLIRLTRLQNVNPLLYEMIYNFIVLALVEEAVKGLAFQRALKKTDYACSWQDVVVLMTIVHIGFELIESLIYTIGTSIPIVLVRGICIPHAGYGFIVGYFCGKGMKEGKAYKKWIGFVLSWLIHGLYDFSLSEAFIAINDNLVFVAIALALLDILLVINLIVFVRRTKRAGIYRIQP